MMVFAYIVSGILALFACGLFATGISSCLTGNWSWIELLNQSIPPMLHFSNPTSADFWNSISLRPWSDPMPVILLLSLFFLLTAGRIEGYILQTNMAESLRSIENSISLLR